MNSQAASGLLGGNPDASSTMLKQVPVEAALSNLNMSEGDARLLAAQASLDQPMPWYDGDGFIWGTLVLTKQVRNQVLQLFDIKFRLFHLAAGLVCCDLGVGQPQLVRISRLPIRSAAAC